MPTLYVETSIVSYLRGQPSPRVVVAARQVLTRRWWEGERGDYDRVTSQYVLDEVGEGDPALARERRTLLDGIPLLPVVPEIARVADTLLRGGILPAFADPSSVRPRRCCPMKPTESEHDAVIEEIHRTRRRIAERFGGNLLAMIEDARVRQATSGHPLWRPNAATHTAPSTGDSCGRRSP